LVASFFNKIKKKKKKKKKKKSQQEENKQVASMHGRLTVKGIV
jgi:hypothetical protein